MDAVVLALRFGLAIIFLLAGVSKVFIPAQFAQVVRNFALLPSQWSFAVARWLPRVELACGLLLGLGIWQRPIGWLLALLLLLFAGGVVINLIRGTDIDCGCFGLSGQRRISRWTVGRNVCLAGFAVLVATHPVPTLALSGTGASAVAPSTGDGIAVLMTTVLTVTGVFLGAEALRLVRSVTQLEIDGRQGADHR